MATRLWNFLTTDVGDLVSLKTIDSAADAADAVLGLAEVLAEEGPNVQKLAPLVGQLDSLLDALNSPLGKLVGATLPFVSIGTGLLKFYLETTKKEPTLAQSVALVSQAAYLESFREFVKQHPKLEQWLNAKDGTLQAKNITPAVKALGQFELTDKEARFATLYFHQSALAIAFNDALNARLVQLGAKPDLANQIVDRVAQNTNRHMRNAIADAAPDLQRVVEWYRTGGDQVFEKYLSIDSYLDEAIAPCPHQQVFAEDFTFSDIYVPLKAQALTSAGEANGTEESFVLEAWARQCLNDSTKSGQVMFVQGGPGRGKSVFCRMFADWVRRHEHPRWTPILIRLRDVSVLSNDFEETLAKAIDRDFAKTDSGWLTDRNVNFLFILDGFDELLMEGRTSGGLDRFLDQVGRFQEQCARNSEKNHRILITGRTLSLQSIERSLPPNLERVEILPMDDDLQAQWFVKWGRLMGQDPNYLRGILKDPRLPDRLQELAREPLLLYLLGAMHRDGALRLEMFEGAEGAKAKVLIYETALDWVLTKQRPERLNLDIAELDTESLRRILMEAGLCVVQSGMEFARIGAIAQRLQQDSAAKQFLDAAQQRLQDSEAPLRNALAAFYMQSGRQGEGSIEFVHKSFGEFLCAERIVKSLIDWCQPGRNREYDIQDAEFCWGVYDLLGCHVLTSEILELVIQLLLELVIQLLLDCASDEIERLFDRLYSFYLSWREGDFIDSLAENLPQRKQRQIQDFRSDSNQKLGIRQIDFFAGINALCLILNIRNSSLLEKDDFYPFGDPSKLEKEHWVYTDLSQIIDYSSCVSPTIFLKVVGPHLQGVNISRQFLESANLSFLNLENANIQNSVLFASNLTNSNLKNANLTGARLEGIYWNEDTNWDNVIGLDKAIGVPDALKRQLGLDRP
ncbi:NACHT domain-containing protein [Nodosilinea nodulosa]|uniref:NACHT domain-containing protein n=1 Tax=Nodosilinea nodulosa TaxID=416001 RepID=UPI000319467F|nr:NACHT domain-containing protein [Nodosilinea nodulosa]